MDGRGHGVDCGVASDDSRVNNLVEKPGSENLGTISYLETCLVADRTATDVNRSLEPINPSELSKDQAESHRNDSPDKSVPSNKDIPDETIKPTHSASIEGLPDNEDTEDSKDEDIPGDLCEFRNAYNKKVEALIAKYCNSIKGKLGLDQCSIDCAVFLIGDHGQFNCFGSDEHPEGMPDLLTNVVAPASALSQYGEPFVYPNHEGKIFSNISEEQELNTFFQQKLDQDSSIVLAPINGPNRSYGVIYVKRQAENRMVLPLGHSDFQFSANDVLYLALTATHLGQRLRDINGNQKLGFLGYLGNIPLSGGSPGKEFSDQSSILYDDLNAVIWHLAEGEESCVVAASLRLYDQRKKHLVTVAFASRTSGDPKNLEPRPVDGDSIVAKVFQNGDFEGLDIDRKDDIDLKSCGFKNIDWLKANNIKSIYSAGLRWKGEVPEFPACFGTLTLYMGHKHVFTKKEKKYFRVVANGLTAIILHRLGAFDTTHQSSANPLDLFVEAHGNDVALKSGVEIKQQYLKDEKPKDGKLKDEKYSLQDLLKYIGDAIDGITTPAEERSLFDNLLVALDLVGLGNTVKRRELLYVLTLFTTCNVYPLFPETIDYAITRIKSRESCFSAEERESLGKNLDQRRKAHDDLKTIKLKTAKGTLKLQRVDGYRNSYRSARSSAKEFPRGILLAGLAYAKEYKTVYIKEVRNPPKPSEYAAYCSHAAFRMRSPGDNDEAYENIMVITLSEEDFLEVVPGLPGKQIDAGDKLAA